MGFDNECILNIQSLAGEYFCPVCRLLVYPNEAIQSQCTHLYCKPCLTYVAGTTRACPYDGYLVTEADSKPLVESNKALAEAIDKVAVHCLFHRSGCTWQGPLSDCTSHCAGCLFGNYPVACNRCGIQIVHRQVQEHAQKCPGVPSQTQQTEISQATVIAASAQDTNQKQVVGQVGAVPSQSQFPQPTVATPALVSAQQTNPLIQTNAAAVPTQGQILQQHQQYPGYDASQQHFQQYYPYQQQAVQQYQQQPPGQAISQYPTQPQAQPPQLPQPHIHAQASMLVPLQNHQINPPHQVYHAVHPQAQVTSQSQPSAHGNVLPQTLPQPYPMMSHPQQVSQIPQYQQPHAQMHQSLPQVHLQPHSQPQSQSQPRPLSQPLPQSQPQLQHHSQPQPQPQPQPNPFQPNQPPPNMQHQSAHAVSGYHSYQQSQPPQHSMAMHPQVGTNERPQLPHQMQSYYPQHHAQMPPAQYHNSFSNQQPPTMLPNPSQGTAPSAQQPLHTPLQPGHLIHRPPVGQPPSSVPNHFHQHSGFNQPQLHMQSQLRPQAPFPPQHSSTHPSSYSHQTVSSHGTQSTQSHNHTARPTFPTPGTQSQSLGGNQQSATPSHPVKASNQIRASEEQLGQQISQPLIGQDKLSEKTADGQELKQVENENDEREKKERLINHVDKSVGTVGDDQKNVAIAPLAQVEIHSKLNESSGQAENLQEQKNSHKDNDIIAQPKNAQTEKDESSTLTTGGDSSSNIKGKILPKSNAPWVHGIDEGRGLPPPPGHRAAAGPFLNHGVRHRPSHSNYGPALPSMQHTGSPVPTQLVQDSGFHATQLRPDDPRYLGIAGQPLNRHDFIQPLGMGPGPSGPSQRSDEFRPGVPQEFFGHRMGPSHAGGPMNPYHGPLGGPLMGALPHLPHGGIMPRGANHGREHSMGRQHFNHELHLLDPLKRGPLNFNSGLQAPIPRLNHPTGPEPLFRSSYIQDRGFYNGNTFDNPRKRKAPSVGWCRICKVDCETMERLEHHCQVREHQDRAMDIVRYIKQSSSNTKIMATNVYPGGEDTRKSKGVTLENRRNMY